MAATGEECYYQKPIHLYFDSSYDLTFDAHIEHYCGRFDKNVVPAQCCGTVCPEFKPLVGIPQADHAKADEDAAQAAKRAQVRKFILRRLYEVCDVMRESAKDLAERTAKREQRLRKLDDWLRRPDTRPEILGNDIAAAEQEIAKALAEQARVQRRLEALREGHGNLGDVELVWVEQERWAIMLERARQRKQRAEELLGERERREAQYEQVFARWDGGDERLPLLIQLRWEVTRRVRARLADSENPLTDANCDDVLRFLQDVAQYAGRDVSIAALQAKVDEVSQGDSTV